MGGLENKRELDDVEATKDEESKSSDQVTECDISARKQKKKNDKQKEKRQLRLEGDVEGDEEKHQSISDNKENIKSKKKKKQKEDSKMQKSKDKKSKKEDEADLMRTLVNNDYYKAANYFLDNFSTFEPHEFVTKKQFLTYLHYLAQREDISEELKKFPDIYNCFNWFNEGSLRQDDLTDVEEIINDNIFLPEYMYDLKLKILKRCLATKKFDLKRLSRIYGSEYEVKEILKQVEYTTSENGWLKLANPESQILPLFTASIRRVVEHEPIVSAQSNKKSKSLSEANSILKGKEVLTKWKNFNDLVQAQLTIWKQEQKRIPMHSLRDDNTIHGETNVHTLIDRNVFMPKKTIQK
uniref:Uncharacterized protein n=1 Tax=Strigamia maritima TaxID=126957 RepID=T1IVY3_STRMM